MTNPGALGFDPDAMGAVHAIVQGAVDRLGDVAPSMPEGPDAGLSTGSVAQSFYAVADVMQMLTGELQLVGDNITAQSSIYAVTDGDVGSALRRAEGQ